MKKWMNLAERSAEQISRTVFYLLVGIAAIVGILFFLVGYDNPFEGDPTFVAPLFTDVLLVLLFTLLLLTIGGPVWMMGKSVRVSRRQEGKENGIAVGKIRVGVTMLTMLLLVVFYAMGSSETIQAGGLRYSNVMGLKAADMFIHTGAVLLACAFITMCLGLLRSYRKQKGNKR